MVALDLLYTKFILINASFFYLGNNDLKKISQIVILTEVVNLAKQAFRVRINLAIIAKKKQLERTSKSKLDKKCFNYKKKNHNIKDCHFSTSNKRKPKKPFKEAKRT